MNDNSVKTAFGYARTEQSYLMHTLRMQRDVPDRDRDQAQKKLRLQRR